MVEAGQRAGELNKQALKIFQQIANDGSSQYLYLFVASPAELELELIQTHMTQKPLLWVEVGAHAVRKRSECAGVVWAGAGVAWRLCVCCL